MRLTIRRSALLLLTLALFASCGEPVQVDLPFNITTTYDLHIADTSHAREVHTIDLTDNRDFSMHVGNLTSASVDSIQVQLGNVVERDTTDFSLSVYLASPDSTSVVPLFSLGPVRPDSLARSESWVRMDVSDSGRSMLAELIRKSPHQAKIVAIGHTAHQPLDLVVHLRVFWTFAVTEGLQ